MILKKTGELSALLDSMAPKGGMPRSQALEQQRCAQCSGPAIKFRDDISRKEFTLTAWCQGCQDKFFGI